MKIKKTTVKINGGSMYLISFDSVTKMKAECEQIKAAMERYMYGEELREAYRLINTFEERIRIEENRRCPEVDEVTTVIYSSEAETWFNMLFNLIAYCGEEIQVAMLRE